VIQAASGNVGTRNSGCGQDDQDLCRDLADQFNSIGWDQGVSFSGRFGSPQPIVVFTINGLAKEIR